MVAGLSFAARVKGQAILEVLACFAIVRKKIALYLTDGVNYHRLTLTDDQLLYHLDLDAPTALSFMVQDINQKVMYPSQKFKKTSVSDTAWEFCQLKGRQWLIAL